MLWVRLDIVEMSTLLVDGTRHATRHGAWCVAHAHWRGRFEWRLVGGAQRRAILSLQHHCVLISVDHPRRRHQYPRRYDPHLHDESPATLHALRELFGAPLLVVSFLATLWSRSCGDVWSQLGSISVRNRLNVSHVKWSKLAYHHTVVLKDCIIWPFAIF